MEDGDERPRRGIDEVFNLPFAIAEYIYSTLSFCIIFLLSLLGLEVDKTPTTGSTPTVRQKKKPQASQHYRYKPLRGCSAFRLLELMPGSRADPIVCKLQHLDLGFLHSPLRNELEYEAISYVWGSSAADIIILCDGTQFRITPSLNNALCRVRLTHRPILVWADAICIDQSNLRERKMQVDLMRQIYAQAKRVSICLEEESDRLMEGLSLFRAIFRPLEGTYPRERSRSPITKRHTSILFKIFERHEYKDPVMEQPPQDEQSIRMIPIRALKNSMMQRMGPTSWKNVAKFFDNPWFSRIWVVQEVSESREARVLLGELEIPWHNIVGFARSILRDRNHRAAVLQYTKTKGLQNVLFMNNNTTISSHDPIPLLLQSTRDFGASDPRDKVYAMLHRPIRKPRRYHDFQFLQGRKYVEFLTQSVCLLYLSSIISDHDLADVRSWCLLISLLLIAQHLRWHHSIRSLVLDFYYRLLDFISKLDRIIYSRFEVTDTLYNMLSMQADYSLAAPSVYRMVATRLIERSRKLNILSYVHHVASIDITYPSWVPRWDCPTGDLDVLTALPDHKYRASAGVEHTIPVSPKHQDHLVVEGIRFNTVTEISEVMTGTQFPQLDGNQSLSRNVQAIGFNADFKAREPEDKYPTGESLRRAYIATLTAGRLGRIEREDAPYTRGELHWRINASLRACCGRRQFVTENGYIGIGPAAMQTGDIVCVLFGGCVPYILRTTDMDDAYRIVGESYVHGIMQGEVIDGWRAGRFAIERFVLC